MTEKSDSGPAGVGAVLSIHDRLVKWLHELAFPRWDMHGVDRVGGGYHEHLDHDTSDAGLGVPQPPARGGVRRGRVVARQIYVFDIARRLQWQSPHTDPVAHGADYLFSLFHQGDGEFHTAVREGSGEAAGEFDLYEQAFFLFALARLMPSAAHRHPIEDTALACLSRLRAELGKAEGGFEESNPPKLPLRSNPHMHLLEAALEWIEVADPAHRGTWVALAAELVSLCLTRFADTRTGAVREYFAADWQATSETGRHLVEPGHQFEWAWLLLQWANSGYCPVPEQADCVRAAVRLMQIGEDYGVDPVRGVAFNEIWDDMSVKDSAAKLWPQTERVKAWCAMLGQARTPAETEYACMKIDAAARALAGYLPDSLAGLWHESLTADGKYSTGCSKASSFYHVTCAIDVLRQTVSTRRTSMVYSAPDNPV